MVRSARGRRAHQGRLAAVGRRRRKLDGPQRPNLIRTRRKERRQQQQRQTTHIDDRNPSWRKSSSPLARPERDGRPAGASRVPLPIVALWRPALQRAAARCATCVTYDRASPRRRRRWCLGRCRLSPAASERRVALHSCAPRPTLRAVEYTLTHTTTHARAHTHAHTVSRMHASTHGRAHTHACTGTRG